jgi:hypothetical protein
MTPFEFKKARVDLFTALEMGKRDNPLSRGFLQLWLEAAFIFHDTGDVRFGLIADELAEAGGADEHWLSTLADDPAARSADEVAEGQARHDRYLAAQAEFARLKDERPAVRDLFPSPDDRGGPVGER